MCEKIVNNIVLKKPAELKYNIRFQLILQYVCLTNSVKVFSLMHHLVLRYSKNELFENISVNIIVDTIWNINNIF